MRFPIKIYKNSKKATLMSVLSNILAALLVVFPVVFIFILRKNLNLLALFAAVVSIVLGVIIYKMSDTYSDSIAEKEICESLGKQYLKHSN